MNDETLAAKVSRRRALDAVFGDVLPDSTSDERANSPESTSSSDSRGMSAHDEDLLRDVPPHHG